MDCSLPGSSVHGIFQARVLEWGAIAFSVRFLFINFLHIKSVNVWRERREPFHYKILGEISR